MADEQNPVTEDIGGVQGAEEQTEAKTVTEPAPAVGGTPDQPAPDAGEIEWSAGLIKKPPTPGN